MLLLEALNHTEGMPDGQRTIAEWLLEHRNEARTVTTKQVAHRLRWAQSPKERRNHATAAQTRAS